MDNNSENTFNSIFKGDLIKRIGKKRTAERSSEIHRLKFHKQRFLQQLTNLLFPLFSTY